MTAFWALMHLVAAALVRQTPAPAIMDSVDAAFAARELDHEEAELAERYAVLLGMPSDEAFVMALCRGDRREAFDE